MKGKKMYSKTLSLALALLLTFNSIVPSYASEIEESISINSSIIEDSSIGETTDITDAVSIDDIAVDIASETDSKVASANTVSSNLWTQLTYSGKQSTFAKANDNKYYAVKGTKVYVGTDATVSDKKTLKLNKKGIVKVGKSGTATVTSSLYGNIEVSVINPKLSDKKINLTVGDSKTITVSDVPDGLPIAWISQNQNVVQVVSGNCVAVGVGKTKVTAYVGGRALQAKVTVKDKAGSTILVNAAGEKPTVIKGIKGIKKATIEISDNAISITKGKVKANSSKKTSISGNISDGHNIVVYANDTSPASTSYSIKVGQMVSILSENTHEFVDWKSKNSNIAIISEFGVLVGQSPGTTVIKGKYAGKKVKINVTVSNEVYTGDNEGKYNAVNVIDPINGNTGLTAYIYERGEVVFNLKTSVSNSVSANTHIVTFDSNGGSSINSQEINDGDTVSIPDNPVKDGAVFNGWTQESFLFDFDTAVTTDLLLSADWLSDSNNDSIPDNTYGSDEYIALVLDLNGGTIPNYACKNIALKYIKKGTLDLTDYIPVRDGYTFDGWYDFDGNKCDNTIDVQTDVFLTAYWRYDITGEVIDHSNGYVLFNDAVGHVYARPILSDGTCIAPSIYYVDHTLVGWFYSDDVQYTPSDVFKTMTILTAKWTPTTVNDKTVFYVKFRPMNFEDSFGTTVTYGSCVDKPAQDPKWLHHTFLGWYLGNTEFDFSTKIDRNIVLTAHWDESTYIVHYNGNGAFGNKDDSIIGYSQYININADGFTNPGYKFLGYATEPTATKPTYNVGARVKELAENQDDEVTLYAIWEAQTVNYTVRHRQMSVDDTSYTVHDTETKQAIVGTSVTPNVKSYTGFTAPTTQTAVVSGDGSTVITYDYTRNKYEVTENHDNNIASVTGTGSYYYGAPVTVTATPKDSDVFSDYIVEDDYRYKGSIDYSFEKWDDNSTAATRTFTMPANNVEVTASGKQTNNITNEEYKLELTADSNITSTTPIAGTHWYAKGSVVDVTATYPDDYIAKGTGKYTMNQGHAVSISTTANTITLTWTGTLSNYGDYLGEFTGTTGDISKIGWKTIQYTDVDGNTRFVNPYVSGSITIKPGTEVIYKIATDGNNNYKVIEYGVLYPVSGTLSPLIPDTDGTTDTSFKPSYTPTSEVTLATYKVVHRKMNLDGRTYTTELTETLHAIPYKVVTPKVKNFTGFTAPSLQTIAIQGDGSTVVTYDYTRNKYSLNVSAGTNINSVTGSGTYYFGETVPVSAIPNSPDTENTYTEETGYRYYKVHTHPFNSWSNGESNASFNYTMPANDVTLTAAAGDDNSGKTGEQYYLNLIAGNNISAVHGTGWYDKGSSVPISATVKSNDTDYTTQMNYRYKNVYTFSKWSDNNATNNRNITVTEPLALTATAVASRTSEQWYLTVDKGEHISAVTGSGWYASGTEVTLSATPDATETDSDYTSGGTGYRYKLKHTYSLKDWSGGTVTDNKYTTGSSAVTLTANSKDTTDKVSEQYLLTITRDGENPPYN